MALSNTNCERWHEVKDTTARVARGTVAGFMGGIIASWVMNQYQAVESRPVNVRKHEKEMAATRPGKSESKKSKSDNGDPTVKVAQMVSRKLIHHELTPAEKKIAGPTVHFGYGAAVGALYGGLSELLPTVSIGLGIPYATLLWLGGDEIAVPALGLGKLPTEVPTEEHASKVATHFVYGITLDISRRILRRIL
jgi:putative membrane protein